MQAAFEASNSVLIALLGLCLRSRHISSARNGIDVVVYFRKKKKPQWNISFILCHTCFIRVSQHFSQAVHLMPHNDNEQRKRKERISLFLSHRHLSLSLNGAKEE